jgi:hypothetical protein
MEAIAMTLEQLRQAYARTKGARAIQFRDTVIDRRKLGRFLKVASGLQRRCGPISVELERGRALRITWREGRGGLVLYRGVLISADVKADIIRRCPHDRGEYQLRNKFTADQVQDAGV